MSDIPKEGSGRLVQANFMNQWWPMYCFNTLTEKDADAGQLEY